MAEEGQHKKQHQEATTMEAGLLDSIISRLLEFRQTRVAKQPQVQLSENEIRQLCAVSREIFLQQPNLLELEAPIKICDDTVLECSSSAGLDSSNVKQTNRSLIFR
ncbi:unnamed protein product [Dovyalis caffra]|uniref:protein-serine/threonine phosphatase n=1 Tax=Dovyalis caffra TaxID=77055 RepID=A0AAV1RA43_9ROSI|nr:unnamed protein product [Dovyalis caffra]